MRLSAIADRLAALDGREADEIHIKLRNPLLKNLLTSEAGRLRNSPAEYAPEEVFRARLLLVMADLHLTTAELEKVNVALNQPPTQGIGHPASAKAAGGYSYPSGLLSIIRGARAGEEWHVRFRVTRTSDGQRRVAPLVFWANGQPAETGVAGLLDLLDGETHLGTIVIPASDLIRPLLDLLEG